jgi:hypothetical protein
VKITGRAAFLIGAPLVLSMPLVSLLGCDDSSPATPAVNLPGTGFDAAPAPTTTSPGPSPEDAGEDAADAGVRCSIGIDDMITASIRITADDHLTLWVNGQLVDDKTTTWGTVDTKTVTLFRHPSKKNVIAVDGTNAFNQAGIDRGLLAELSFGPDAGTTADGGTIELVTDTAWKISWSSPDGGVPDGGLPDGGVAGVAAWFDPAFNDSSWLPAFDEGAHGIGPWGNVFGTSSAHWLWGYDSSSDPSKPTNEDVYFRRTFYVSAAGTPQDAAGSCQ